MLFSLVACGSSSTQQVSTSAESSISSSESTTASTTSQVPAAKTHKIGFSQSFNGNTFRQAVDGAVTKACDEMKAAGRISEYSIAQANNDVATQISQINGFILDGCDIIIIDPASSSGLNDVITNAVKEGIVVFAVSDGPLDTPGLCYEINTKPTKLWHDVTIELAALIGDKGNVLVSRGIIGVAFEKAANEGVDQALSELPNMKKVGEIEGKWTDSVAKEAFAQILPTLDYNVDLIIGQGGDDKVAIDLFEAAGKKVPVILGQGRGNFLKWWANEYEKSGYQTISISADINAGAKAVYTALDIADGVVSFSGDNMSMDAGGIICTTDMLKADLSYFKNMSDDAIFAPTITYQDAVAFYTPYANK